MIERVSREAKSVVSKLLNDTRNYASYKVNIYSGACGIDKVLWCGHEFTTPANENRGVFSGGGFVCDKDTVFAYYRDDVVFWHKGYLAHMKVSSSNFDIYISDDVPCIESGDAICVGTKGYKRPCNKWVEPVEDRYIVLKEINDYITKQSGDVEVGFKAYNFKRNTLWLVSSNDKVGLEYRDLQKMVKLGILSASNLIGMRVSNLVIPHYISDNEDFDAGDIVIKNGYIWCNGRMAKLGYNSHIFIERGTSNDTSTGNMIVSSSTMKCGVSKNVFLRSMI